MFVEPGYLESLRSDAPIPAQFLESASWPPSGYRGADADQELAAALSARLRSCGETTSARFPFGAFVNPPGRLVEGEDRALMTMLTVRSCELRQIRTNLRRLLDQIEKNDGSHLEIEGLLSGQHLGPDSRRILLGMAPEEISEAMSEKGESWWKDLWSEKEFRDRLAASSLMAEQLIDVNHWVLELDEGWGLAYYQGQSKTGAIVGVVAARLSQKQQREGAA